MFESKAKPRLPPRSFMRLVWFTHRGLYRLTGGRLGLWRPRTNGWGAMRLTTVGRQTSLERSVLVSLVADLQGHSDAQVDLPDGPRLVTRRGRRRVPPRP